MSEITRLTGSETVATQASQILVWAMLGVARALVIGRWSSPFLAALWTVAGTAGGTAAQATAFYLANASAYPIFLAGVTSQAAAGALYGTATGVVLAMIVKRLGERQNTEIAR